MKKVKGNEGEIQMILGLFRVAVQHGDSDRALAIARRLIKAEEGGRAE